MRALFFVETPHRLTGAPRSLLASLLLLETHGIDPLVVFPAHGIVEQAFRRAGVATRILHAPPALLLFNKRILTLTARQRLEAFLREFLPYNAQLKRVIEEERAAVVHFNTPRGILVGGLAARLARRPTCLHVRGSVQVMGSALWTACQVLADRIILVAEALRGEVFRPFLPRSSVIYNGISPASAPDRSAARTALARRLARTDLADKVVFASLSSLTPFKGLHHLLEAVAIALDRGASVHCVLAGAGGDAQYRNYLSQIRKTRGLENAVDILGFVDDPLDLLAGADVLVLPTVFREVLDLDGTRRELKCSEGLPRVILEAMALGLPSIATDVAGVREQIEDRVTGYVVPPSDPNALANAMCAAARDGAWRARAGERARELVQDRFTVQRSAEELACVLKSIALTPHPPTKPSPATPGTRQWG